jgi:hypothetical protein
LAAFVQAVVEVPGTQLWQAPLEAPEA